MRWNLLTTLCLAAVFQRILAWYVDMSHIPPQFFSSHNLSQLTRHYREISLYADFCPGQEQGAADDKRRSLLYMSGAPGDQKWCTAVARGSKPAFTLATRGVVGDAVEVSLYADAECREPVAANITFDGCIAGPREVRVESQDGKRGSPEMNNTESDLHPVA